MPRAGRSRTPASCFMDDGDPSVDPSALSQGKAGTRVVSRRELPCGSVATAVGLSVNRLGAVRGATHFSTHICKAGVRSARPAAIPAPSLWSCPEKTHGAPGTALDSTRWEGSAFRVPELSRRMIRALRSTSASKTSSTDRVEHRVELPRRGDTTCRRKFVQPSTFTSATPSRP